MEEIRNRKYLKLQSPLHVFEKQEQSELSENFLRREVSNGLLKCGTLKIQHSITAKRQGEDQNKCIR